MPLFDNVQYIKSVGPKVARLLKRLDIETVSDLFYHIPARYIDRRSISQIKDLVVDTSAVVIGEVFTCGFAWLGRKRHKIFEIILKDETGSISLKWFNFYPGIEQRFKKGDRLLVAGVVSEFRDTKQFIHPEVDILESGAEEELDTTSDVGGRIIPVYPLTQGLTQRQMRKILRNAWDRYSGEIEEELPDEVTKKLGLVKKIDALASLHFPESSADIELLNLKKTEAHKRLIFEEFFLLEAALHMRRQITKSASGIAFNWRDELTQRFISLLNFELTTAQKRVVEEIKGDMTKSIPMQRLIQGDVGSGKTVVAAIASIQVANNGYQVAIMAPTEILAEQHFKNLSPHLEKMGISSTFLSSSIKGHERDKIYEAIKSGETKCIFGTHALIQEGVRFKRLGLVVIDEQHRFGVEQKTMLYQKGEELPDLIVMTATPIPRTLAMAFYGDLDISKIDEMPRGRLPIITKIYYESQRERLYAGMRKELEKGHQMYVVYPLIEESEKIDMKNATEMYQVLKGVFAPRFNVALLHGRMKGEEKEAIMAAFKAAEIQILVATSVVEVGIDVPNATVMIIEHAERFGLSQLHQLRGRVGRGNLQSYCILMAPNRASEEAMRRLKIIAETTDGFKIAEEDLKIRGPGEFLGTRQSGLPEFKVADILRDADILEVAKDMAFKLDVDKYPALKKEIESRWGDKILLSLG